MSDDGVSVEPLVIRSRKARALRAVVPGLLMGAAALIFGMSQASVDPVAIRAGATFAACAIVFCLGRSLLWLAMFGGQSVHVSREGLEFRSEGHVERRFTWEEVEGFYVESGDARPEWSRWASFPRIHVWLDRRKRWKSRGLLVDEGALDRLDDVIQRAFKAFGNPSRRSDRGWGPPEGP